MQYGLVDGGSIIAKKERDFTYEDKEHIEEIIKKSIIEYIQNLLDEKNIDIKDIEKIGIAAPGTCSNGKIVKAENLGLYDFNIVKEIKKKFDIEIILNNDAKCAAMCEKIYGNLKDCDDAIFMCLGTGIGGAVFIDGKLLKPKKYEGFEMGHVVIERNGKRCSCGRQGCFETYCSMRVLKEKIRKRVGTTYISPDEIRSILKHEYDSVKDIIEEFIYNLSIGIANYINIFEPEKIVLGGSFVYYKDMLLPKLVDRLNKEEMTFNENVPKITVTKYNNDAGMIGATLM